MEAQVILHKSDNIHTPSTTGCGIFWVRACCQREQGAGELGEGLGGTVPGASHPASLVEHPGEDDCPQDSQLGCVCTVTAGDAMALPGNQAKVRNTVWAG